MTLLPLHILNPDPVTLETLLPLGVVTAAGVGLWLEMRRQWRKRPPAPPARGHGRPSGPHGARNRHDRT